MYKFGWIKQPLDIRDKKYKLVREILPTSIDLSLNMPAVFDQGNYSSCVGNGIATAIEYSAKRNILDCKDMIRSRMFIYYNARKLENVTFEDNGCNIRDGIKSINSAGCCSETTWDYTEPHLFTMPDDNAFSEALTHKTVSYTAVDITNVKSALNAQYPVVLGMDVFPQFESSDAQSTGTITMPLPYQGLVGRHCIVCFGFDDEKQVWKCRNSWGEAWGDHGNFTLPYGYEQYWDDLWQIQVVS
jgi:C1A family cysteine protease